MHRYAFIIGRYFMYGFMGAEVLLLPLLVTDKAGYGDIEYFKALIAMVPLLLMGFHSGYLRTIYTEKEDLSRELLVGGALLMIPVSAASAIFFGNPVLFFACMASGMALFLEKIYQKEQKFILALMYKPMIAVLNISLVLLAYRVLLLGDSVNILTLVSCSYIAALLLYSLPNIKLIHLDVQWNGLWAGIKKLVTNGFWLNFGTMCVGIFLFLDRTYLRSANPEALADYSFAFNVSQILFVFFTSLSYINEVKLGESVDRLSAQAFLSAIKRIVLILLAGVALAIVGYHGLLQFFPEYSSSLGFLYVLAPSWGLFFAAGTLGVVAQYIGKQKLLSLFFLGVTAVNGFFLWVANCWTIASSRFGGSSSPVCLLWRTPSFYCGPSEDRC